MVPRIWSGKTIARHVGLTLLLTLGAAPVTAQALNSTTALSLRDRLDSLDSATELIAEQDAIRKFYEERAFAPLWFTSEGPTDAARRIMRELEQADSWGLRLDDFTLSEAARADGPRNDDQLAAAEFELSTLVLKYARHASGGRISEPERQLSDYIDRRAEMPNPAEVLRAIANAAAPEDVLRSYHPQHDQFQKLRALYVKLRGPADAAKFAIARTGKMLVPGDKDPEIEALRGRLGVAATAGNADVYDAPLLVAVKAFQKANRLSADGYVGPRTRAAFQRGDNQVQMKQILASMEQWRWMPRDLGQRHALVNIPAYSIDFVEGGRSVLNERVIVGRPDTPTPVFSKSMSSIVLKPSWILPDSIKREKLLRGRSLEGQGLVVKKGNKTVKSWAVDWSKANLSHYAVYQPSGDGNALGTVKFLFPNKYSVYLHDTPNKSLFSSSERTYSHGCIRLRDPLKVAQFIFDWDQGPGMVDVKRLSARGPDNNEITLTKPLPVHVGYFTVWVGADGEAQYLDDPYGHVQRVSLALNGQWDKIDRGPRHDTDPQIGVYADLTDQESLTKLRGKSSSKSGKRKAAAADGAAPGFNLISAPGYKPSNYRPGYVGSLMNSAFAR